MAEFLTRIFSMTADFITCPIFLFVGLPLMAIFCFDFIFYIIRRKRVYIK